MLKGLVFETPAAWGRRAGVSRTQPHMQNLRAVDEPMFTILLLFQGSRHDAIVKLSLLSTEPVEQFWVIDELCMTGVLAAFGGAAEFLDDLTQSHQTRLQSLLVAQCLQ